jgi:tRNA threonylcarbamoyladenosine modification (KEOPS) complex Cgi121 subunit
MLIETLQMIEKEGVHIQIFNPDMIFSPKHLYYAVYFAEQAYALSSNISNNKAVEFLIYASFQRQIKNAIESVGFTIEDGNSKPSAYIVITSPSQSSISTIYKEILLKLHAIPKDDISPPITSQRIDDLKDHFHISEFELQNALLCMDNSSQSKFDEVSEPKKIQALLFIATERMSQLLMENFKSN